MDNEIALLVPKRRKLTVKDIGDIAKLVAMRLTETEACLRLDINPRQWFQFKQRKAEKFESAISRVRGAKVQACIETLESAAKAVNLKTGIPEWRAADRLLERLDDRFVLKGDVNVNVGVISGASQELLESARQAFLSRSCGVSALAEPAKHTISSVQSEAKNHKTQVVDASVTKPE